MLTTLLIPLLPMLVLSGCGLLMMRSHHRAWVTQREHQEDRFDLQHLAKRYRRRMQASGMLVLLGVLITGGQFINGKAHPTFFSIYWVVVLLLTFWLMLIALGDAFSIAAYSKVAQIKLEHQRRELESEYRRLKSQQENGHADTQNLSGNQERSHPQK